jgi:uncharacterized protein YigE (DUF2233 family)
MTSRSLRSASAVLAALGLILLACRRESARARGTLPFATDAADDAPRVDATTPQSHLTQKAIFALSEVTLAIEDLHMSTRLDGVLAQTSAVAAVNGAFFDAEGNPVGLAISRGRLLSRFSPLMSGGVLWVRDWAHDGTAHLTATEEYREQPVDFAIQCRPRLVVGGRVNIRSDDGRHAARTALCLRDAGHAIELVIAQSEHGDGGPTLFQFAGELLAEGCEDALNLDGGPSTAWASGSDAGSIFRPPAAPVRHAVVVRRR